MGGIGRGLIVAIPLLVLLGVLLAQADAVFASFFDVAPVPIDRAIVHIFFFVVAATMVIVVLRRGRNSSDGMTERTSWRVGSVEAIVVLVGLDILFAVFTVAQLVRLAGGGDAAIAAAGMTYSEYARQGFFQLLWVAGITLVILMGTRHSHTARAIRLGPGSLRSC